MKISQALIKIVQGSKGSASHKWWRVSRTTLEKIASRVSSEHNFYYAKVYHYTRNPRQKGKGKVGKQIGYIYWKDGVLTWVAS